MMARTCEACGEFIKQKAFVGLLASEYASNGPDNQDPFETACGDYCDACVLNGAAMKSLLAGLKYEPRKKKP